jgi:hypothetical protein
MKKNKITTSPKNVAGYGDFKKVPKTWQVAEIYEINLFEPEICKFLKEWFSKEQPILFPSC